MRDTTRIFRKPPEAQSARDLGEKSGEPCRILSRLSRRPQGGPATTAQLEPRGGSSCTVRHVRSHLRAPDAPPAHGALILGGQPPMVHAATRVQDQRLQRRRGTITGTSLGPEKCGDGSWLNYLATAGALWHHLRRYRVRFANQLNHRRQKLLQVQALPRRAGSRNRSVEGVSYVCSASLRHPPIGLGAAQPKGATRV